MQHTATPLNNTMQHTATPLNNTQQCTAIYCTATHCNTPQENRAIATH